MLRIVRYSSSLSKLWVKHNGSQATQVSTIQCVNISDLTKVIKQELSIQLSEFDSSQLTLHKSFTEAALSPGLPITTLLKSLETNTAESPLLIKTPEPTTVTQKTIFIQDIDEECHPIPGSFIKFVIENNTDLNNLFTKKGEYLTLLSNPKYGITKFKQLIDGERYKIKSHYEQSFIDELHWQQNEDKAMEQETYLAVKQFLATHLGPSVEDMPTNIMGSDKKTIVQEWDAIFKDGNVLYLCEAKHNMTFEHVNKFPARIQKFKEFQTNAQPEFRNITKYVGVLCGTLFPDLVRDYAHKYGFICVYPSGHRYNVKNPPDDFIIEKC